MTERQNITTIPEQSVTKMPRNLNVIVARALQALFSHSTDVMDACLLQLQLLFKEEWGNAHQEVITAITNRDAALDGGEMVRTAYMLGQLSFAQQIVSTLRFQRLTDDHLKELKHRKYKIFFHTLFLGECTRSALQSAVHLQSYSFSMNLRRLQELSMVDIRKEGGVTLFFLTPQGVEVYKQYHTT